MTAELLTNEFENLILKADKDIVPEGRVHVRNIQVKQCGCCGVVDLEVQPLSEVDSVKVHLNLQEFDREFFDGVDMERIREDSREIVDSVVRGDK